MLTLDRVAKRCAHLTALSDVSRQVKRRRDDGVRSLLFNRSSIFGQSVGGRRQGGLLGLALLDSSDRTG